MKWDDAKEREHWEMERRIHAHSTSTIDTLQPMTDEMWAAESDRIKKLRIDFLTSRGLADYDGTPGVPRYE